MADAKKKFEDLNLSNDEVKRIGECLKNEEFRKLFVEYAEELQDPENRRRYEEELRQMENERGMDVEFVHPKPGHVLKTSVDGDTKAFINICINDLIEKPNSVPQNGPDGRRGLHWQIPHSFSPPRDDIDKEKKKCKVFDVVFNSDTYRMGQNPRFMKLVEDTAIDGIEQQFGVKLDRKNIINLKNLKYKGVPTATVIRRKSDGKKKDPKEMQEVLQNMPYPYGDKSSEEISKEMREKVEKQKAKEKSPSQNEFTEPNYRIVHRTNMDLQEYRNAPDARPSTRPKELVITIELPLLTSAKQVYLDIFEQKLVLQSESPAKYKLDLKLPYPVDDENGGAKFDKSKHSLIVTLPVLPMKDTEMPSFAPVQEMEKKMEDALKPAKESNQIEPDEAFEDLPPLEDVADKEGGDKENAFQDLPPLEDVEDEEEGIDGNEEGKNEHEKSKGEEIRKKTDIEYTFPDFSHHQDDSTVSFVLNVKNISDTSVSKTFPSPNSICLRFFTLGSGGFPMHYCFCVQFSPSETVVPDHCSVDVSDTNLVLLALKAKESRGQWNKFEAGHSMEQLQVEYSKAR